MFLGVRSATIRTTAFTRSLLYPVDDANDIRKLLELPIVNVKDDPYFATGDGTTDDATGIQAAIDAVEASGGVVFFPAGTYHIGSPLTIDSSDVALRGVGMYASILEYEETDGTACVHIEDSGSTLFRIAVTDLQIIGNNTATGGAIYSEDVSEALFENLFINDFDAASSSYGIKSAGRDGTTFRECYIADTTICLHFLDNPNHATVHIDLYRIVDCVLGPGDPNDGYGIKIEADAVTNFRIDHTVVVQAAYGIWWENNASFSATAMWTVSDFRMETMDSAGWGIWLNPNDDALNMVFTNILYGGNGSGFYSRNCQNIVFVNPSLAVVNSETDYNIDSEGTPIIFVGGYENHLCTTTIADEQLFHTTATDSGEIGLQYWGGQEFLAMDRGIREKNVVMTYGATVTPDLREGNSFYVDVTDGNAMTVAQPSTDGGGIGAGEGFSVIIENSSGGVMGNITWGTRYKFDGGTAPTKPGNGKALICHFQYGKDYCYMCVAFGDDYTM